MKLNLNHKFIQNIKKEMEDAIYEAISNCETYASVVYCTDYGEIEAYTDIHDEKDVMVANNDEDKFERIYINITDAILEVIPDWGVIRCKFDKNNEDEWQAHGFRDAADYYKWKYG